MLQQLLSGIGTVWLAETCTAYHGMAKRVAEIVPDLVLVDIDHDPEQAVFLIQSIAQSHPGVVVLPASRAPDSSILLRVIRAGAREFLTLPTHANEINDTLNRLFNRHNEVGAATDRDPQVIAVTGAAGGVGCTSLAVNLAIALARTNTTEVILADLDLLLGCVDACLDIVTNNTLFNVVQNIDRLDLTLLKRSVTRHGSGLFVLPHPTAMEDAAKIDPDVLRRVLMLLKAAFPAVILDTSKGLQTSDFLAFEMADVILMVVQLDLTCLRNTARLLHLFHQFDGLSEKVKLVVNRTGSNDTEISPKKAEETLKMPIHFNIPNATKVYRAARAKGVPIDEVAAGTRPHQSVLSIARALRPSAAVVEVKPKRGLFAALF
ncbi:MAG: AAA family ATPase [Isosphaeraceae bacterium]|nr:AAA family ATPase [Isosphaeraceae bacterium]